MTGGDGILDYPLTRARVAPIMYFGVTRCHRVREGTDSARPSDGGGARPYRRPYALFEGSGLSRMRRNRVATEVVTLSSDERSAAISGRAKVSLWLKFNPIWWFFNDAEQNLAHAEWYNSDLPQWQRAVLWNLRNPLQNFRAFVAGVADKNYTVRGRPPVMTVQRNDLFAPETGWQWCVLAGGDLWFPRFFVSYSGKRVVWYFGHQPTGFWGAKFNLNL
jgi:hypothetical protein